MTVKERRGRRRYIAFRVRDDLTKDAVIAVLRRVCGNPPYVVQCAEGWMIVRCSPSDAEDTIRHVGLADPSSVSLRTSGTLASLRNDYPELKRLRPVRRAV
jgi:RNase P/RNase MRP subunit POP5